MNLNKIKEEIENYQKNRDLAKRSLDTKGAVAFCNGAIHELSKVLKGEYRE